MKLLKNKIAHMLLAAVLLLAGVGIGLGISSWQRETQSDVCELHDADDSAPVGSSQDSVSEERVIYYWVPEGKVYHVSSACPTLNRSKEIQKGEIPPADRRACKVCS